MWARRTRSTSGSPIRTLLPETLDMSSGFAKTYVEKVDIVCKTKNPINIIANRCTQEGADKVTPEKISKNLRTIKQ
jgi:hypothetical protein